MMNRDPLWHGANKIDGYQDWMLANRISYEFGLTGPRYVVQEASSVKGQWTANTCVA